MLTMKIKSSSLASIFFPHTKFFYSLHPFDSKLYTVEQERTSMIDKKIRTKPMEVENEQLDKEESNLKSCAWIDLIHKFLIKIIYTISMDRGESE
jgi:hypothetical protein